MKPMWIHAAAVATASGIAAVNAQSNIDPAHKFAWCENIGWTNWLDANGMMDGVFVDTANGFLEGFTWSENTGWINAGPGGGPYLNTTGLNFGVNILGNGDLDGFAWGENIGWINFGWAANTANADRARFDSGASRFRGYAWGENVGWMNLDDGTHYVGVLAVAECGPCQLYTDLEAFYCLIDIGDVVKVLDGYGEATPCTTISALGITPGALVYDGGCPVSCTVDTDCTGVLGQDCVNGLCCDLTDISEVIEVLDMYSDVTTPNCPNPCTYGACELPLPANCCRDGTYLSGAGDDQGTSQSDCGGLGGTYLGNNTTCAASALPPCP